LLDSLLLFSVKKKDGQEVPASPVRQKPQL